MAGIPALPADALILIPTRSFVLFPGTVLPVTLGRQRSIAAAQAAIRLNRPIGLVLQRDPATEDPIAIDLHRMGTEANVLRYVTSPDGQHHVISQGERRFRIIDFLDGYPFLVARVERLPEPEASSKDIEARMLQSAQSGDRGIAAVAADPGRTGQRRSIGLLGRRRSPT